VRNAAIHGEAFELNKGQQETGALLADPSMPIVPVEAEKSALAITAWAVRSGTRILPVSTGGRYGWRGRIGKKQAADGTSVDEVGALPDLACASQRKVFILFDANAATNPQVQAARAALASQLRKLRADVRILDLPAEDGINGPDDLLALRGDNAMRSVLEGAESGITILNDVANFIRRFVIMSEAQVIATTLWSAHTHGFQVAIWSLTPAQGRTLNTVPQPLMKAHGGARPPDGVVPQSKPDLPGVKPTLGRYPSPPLPGKLWSTVSVHTPPCAGGVSSKTVPHPEPLPQFPPVPPFMVVP
jgi:hypothetical protein